MTKKITYEDYSQCSGNREVNLEQALEVFHNLEWSKNTFLYFPINDINLFQIMWKNDRFLLEITDDSDDMVYLQKYVGYDECKSILIHIFNTSEFQTLQGFYRVPVMTQTLDDVVNGNEAK